MPFLSAAAVEDLEYIMSRDQARVALAARWAAVLLIFVMSMDSVHARTPKSIMMGQDLPHLVDSSSLGRQLRVIFCCLE